ncbi:clathrin coat adaptor subunit, putative [Babesia bigemina]|uniref:Clathrin coat adaptor subunit, putative n=1 Tax=Babesia bigemina TaxID=5866 RepID=A0A061D1F7_BABBI|nr:clathrin coat adaptor subunit, putative [Babesia bigemina]CDR94473.1 clathrin coat adaptor subunit, putative [Babesia bigemina]|eukprot:XP_012766659.1 clathrin coat adaptor subunit, putative [Babesia bigemina]
MISAVFISNCHGSLLFYRAFRGGSSRQDAVMYAKNMIQRSLKPYRPIQQFGFATYVRVKLDALHLVASCDGDVNAALVMQCLVDIRDSIVTLLEAKVTAAEITRYATTLQEMVDLAIDGGFPQDFYMHYLGSWTVKDMTTNLFKKNQPKISHYLEGYGVDYGKYMKAQKMVFHSEKDLVATSDPEMQMQNITVPWRVASSTTRKNEITLFISECINCCYSHVGELLLSEVTGSITMDCSMPGTPKVAITLNTDFANSHERITYASVENKNESHFPLPSGAKVATTMQDFKVHKTVDILRMLRSKQITAVPPQGMTALMLYRCDVSGELPFHLKPVITRATRYLLYYHITIRTKFPKTVTANNVFLKIPLPATTSNVEIINHFGHCQFNLAGSSMHWHLVKTGGGMKYTLEFQCKLARSVSEQDPAIGPIEVEFVLPNFSFSGLFVRDIEVTNTAHKAHKAVQYNSSNGSYQHKLKFPK